MSEFPSSEVSSTGWFERNPLEYKIDTLTTGIIDSIILSMYERGSIDPIEDRNRSLHPGVTQLLQSLLDIVCIDQFWNINTNLTVTHW